MIALYQFQFSHFCEKACWALDFKGVAYERKNLFPGLHIRVAKRLTGKSGLPILVDDGKVVRDSTAIITFLDEKYPERPLTPRSAQAAKEAIEWEEYLDEEIGIQLRLWFYYHTLPDRERALQFLLDGAPWYGRSLLTLVYPILRGAMTEQMNIYAEPARQAEERLLAALDKLDDVVKTRRFLVANSFSRADLTACALLRPYCLPGKSSAEIAAAFPVHVRALRDSHQSRPFVTWVQKIYAEQRHAGNSSAPPASASEDSQ